MGKLSKNIPFGVSFPQELKNLIDKEEERGDISRSKYICRLMVQFSESKSEG